MLGINDSFSVKIEDELTNSNIRTITLLYKPIIGNDSYILYMYLFSHSGMEETYTHESICSDLKVTIQQLDEMFAKLEATSLVDKYYNGRDSYFYELKKPEDPKNLLLEGKFSTYLIDQLSEDEYKRLLLVFNVDDVDLTNYKKSTRTYYQVFGSQKKREKKVEVKKETPIISDVKTYDTAKFSLAVFEQKLQNFRALRNTEKQLIVAVASQYGLNEDDMAEIIPLSSDEGYNIDNVKLHQLGKKREKKVVAPIKKEAPTATVALSEEDRLILKFDESTYEMIYRNFGSIAPIPDIANLDRLKSETGLSTGVINVLLSYLLVIKNGSLPAYNYIQKIASQMLVSDVKTTRDALTFINKQKELHEQRQANDVVEIKETKEPRRKPVREKQATSSEPDWLEEEMKRAFGS